MFLFNFSRLQISSSYFQCPLSLSLAPPSFHHTTWDQRDPFKQCTTRPGAVKKEKFVTLQGGRAGRCHGLTKCILHHEIVNCGAARPTPPFSVAPIYTTECIVVLLSDISETTASPAKLIIVQRKYFLQENHHIKRLELPFPMCGYHITRLRR